jgi:hypothetical protein
VIEKYFKNHQSGCLDYWLASKKIDPNCIPCKEPKKPIYKKVGMVTHHKKNKANKSSRTQVVKEHNNRDTLIH